MKLSLLVIEQGYETVNFYRIRTIEVIC